MNEQIPLRPELTDEPEQRIVMDRGRVAKLSSKVAVGLCALSLAGWAAYEQFFGDSGAITSYQPSVPTEFEIDNTHNVLSWNMHDETSDRYSELASMIAKYNVDVVVLQEVSGDDARGLHKYFPGKEIEAVTADDKTKPLEGGYVNLIMTDQKQNDVESVAMAGNSVPDEAAKTVTGVFADVGNLDSSFKQTSDATQEDRAGIRSAIRVTTSNGGEAWVQTITGHVGEDPKVHERQLHEFEDFVFASESDDQATVVCADFNSSREEITFDFAEHGYIVPETGPTTLSGRTIDFCAYKPNGVLGLGSVEVLPNATDHRAILFSASSK